METKYCRNWTIHYCGLYKADMVNGPGPRVSLFISGCEHKCKGCFSPETWDKNFGKPFTDDVLDEIIERLKKPYCNGLSLLGGDPFASFNVVDTHWILHEIKLQIPEVNIWVYTGYTYYEIVGFSGLDVRKDVCSWDVLRPYLYREHCLDFIDVLVDGPFKENLKDDSLLYRGSSNQRLIDVQKSILQRKVVLLDGEEE